ncbi:MAG TPA: hypothetical protein VED41_11070 [Solirubrobacteraceae bacterium]|nr:hypothetical protein [Solirubrobacteraceae bacterium]
MSSPLVGQLGFISASESPSVGWDLKPTSWARVLSLECGLAELTVTGSVIVPVTRVNKMVRRFSARFVAAGGKQVPEAFEGMPKDTLTLTEGIEEEQAGLTLAGHIAGEEAVEIKARG